jgi:hypothetical protein
VKVWVAEWVRRALPGRRAGAAALESEMKLKAVRRAAEYSFPTADIEQILREI